MNISNLTSPQLRLAADLQEKIASLEKQLAIIFVGGKTHTLVKTSIPAKRKGMSAAGRAKISAAAKLRWAKVKAAKPTSKIAVKPVKKTRKKMSAEAKLKISAAAKARWAKVKAEKK